MTVVREMAKRLNRLFFSIAPAPGLLVLAATLLLTSQSIARATDASTPLGLPPLSPDSKVADRAVIELGKRLFSDVRLSADGAVSCATCHDPTRAFTDGRAHSIGRGGANGSRNAPSLLNVVFLRSFFWDGRVTTLETQVLAPLINPIEHGLESEGSVAEIVRRDSSYRESFARSFQVHSAGISANLIARAVSAYERTLLAGDSPFDRYLFGGEQRAMTPAAVRGLALFRGRAQCASCHTIAGSFALLTDQTFHMTPMGLPASVNANLQSLTRKVVQAMSAGNRGALEKLIASDEEVAALGRFIVTLEPTDIGKFKTPSLRNVAVTAPYMHDGSIATLERAVDLELYGHAGTSSFPIALTVSEREELLAFLQALTSPSAVAAPAKVPENAAANVESHLDAGLN
jgi:cytochrome c peroxidase